MVDATGKPILGQPVAWTWLSRVSSSDLLKTKSSTTNASGVAKATVVLACAPGTRRIRATADAVSGTAVLNLTGAGLPNTSTLPADSRDPSGTSTLGTLLAVLAIAAAGLLAVRRLDLRRR